MGNVGNSIQQDNFWALGLAEQPDWTETLFQVPKFWIDAFRSHTSNNYILRIKMFQHLSTNLNKCQRWLTKKPSISQWYMLLAWPLGMRPASNAFALTRRRTASARIVPSAEFKSWVNRCEATTVPGSESDSAVHSLCCFQCHLDYLDFMVIL